MITTDSKLTESKAFKGIINKYEKKHGYKPNIGELYNLYTDGCLILTDEEENKLIEVFSNIYN